MDSGETEHWQAADRIFEQLLELPDAERETFLDQLSAPPEVLEKVRMLLQAHRQPDEFLDRPARAASESRLPTNALRGRELGGWQLLEELGHGGSSVVYRAQRVAPGPEQQAAVKIFTLASLCNIGVERFQRETEILAKLNHPNIASLIDAGVGDDGTYWLAMQLVEGERIDRHCEKLNTRGVVELFLQLCDAVTYAHRALVVHRDIKPSNVLVEKAGHIRLLDFGIGRFSDDREDITQTLWRALTPGYAAPEQFTGGGVSTSMDVYGLGALLYRLLCGSPPRDGRKTDADASPATPSSRALAAGGHHQRHYQALKQDLDRVLLKALSLEPARRYASADALAEELRRWLAGEPVQAQPPNLVYLWKKFVQRNRTAVAMSAALALAMSAGLAGTAWQMRVANFERTLARKELSRANELNAFVVGLFQANAPRQIRPKLPSTEELLEKGVERARAKSSENVPLSVDMLTVLGDIYFQSGDIDAADALAQEALGLVQGREVEMPLTYARALQLGAAVAMYSDDVTRAREGLQKVEDLYRQYDPESPYRFRNRLNQAVLLEWRDRYQESIEILKALRRDLVGRNVASTELLLEVYTKLGWLHAKLHRHEDARKLYRAALAISEPQSHALSHANLLGFAASNNSRLGLFAEAESQFAAMFDLYPQLFEGPSQHSAMAYQLYGHHLLRRGHVEASLNAFAEARRQWQALTDSGWLQEPVRDLQMIFALDAGHEWAEMEARVRDALAYMRENKQDYPEQYGFLESQLARLLCRRSELAEGLASLEKAQSWREQGQMGDSSFLKRLLEAEATCSYAQGDYQRALAKLEQITRGKDSYPRGLWALLASRELMRSEVLHALGEDLAADRLRRQAFARLDEIGYAEHGTLLRKNQSLLSAVNRAGQ